MKIKTSELTDAALDWAVAKCEGLDYWQPDVGPSEPAYSTDWSQGGPIIERERIQIFPHNGASEWCGVIYVPRGGYTGILSQDGPTPLIAAMRCYVASRPSDEVDVPDELV